MLENQFTWLAKVTACLISSPPLQGKRAFIHSLVFSYLGQGKPVIFITTDHSTEDIKKEWLDKKLFYGRYEQTGNLKFIDCYSMNAGKPQKESTQTIYIPSPLALNELSVALAETEAELFKKSSEHLVVFDSLSTMLLYSNPRTIARFTQVITGKIRQANGRVCYVVEEGMHEKQVMVTIEHLMGAVIHVKQESGKILYQASGIPALQQWKTLESISPQTSSPADKPPTPPQTQSPEDSPPISPQTSSPADKPLSPSR